MSKKIDDLMYEAGLTAQGCWDDMDEYNRTAIMKFAELIVKECAAQCWTVSELEHKGDVVYQCSKRIRKHFGVE